MNALRDSRRGPALLVGAIWLCFLAKAIFYSSFFPLWEGPDEYAHFAFVQYLANTHSLPGPDADISNEVEHSLQLAPVPWTLRNPPARLPHDDFWRLPPEARERRQKLSATLPPISAGEPLYETQQPPLAYLLFWLPYAAFGGADLATRVWILRIAGSLIASTVIPLGYLIAARTLGRPWQAVGVAAVIASMPELLLDVTHVSNEPLAVCLGSLCVLILLSLPDRIHRPLAHGLLLGMALGCALLTKAYFLAVLPALGAIYAMLWLGHRDHRRRIALHATVTACLTFAIAGWWYARNIRMTGSLSGEQTEAAARHSGISVAQAIIHANWLHAIDFALISHIWLGGWSFLVARTWMYRVIEVLLFAGLAGLVLRLSRSLANPASWRLWICFVVAACFWIGPAYHAMVTYRVRGSAESFGYYAYCLIAAEAVCLVAGTSTLLPVKLARFAVPVVVACFALLEVFGVDVILMPYYAGFTAHTAKGGVRAMRVGLLSDGGFGRLFLNLSVFKPPVLSAPVLECLWAAFLLGVAGIIACACFAAHRDKSGQ